MRCYMLRAVGSMSLDPRLLETWVKTVEQFALEQHLDAGRYYLSEVYEDGYYILAVESDLTARAVSNYLRHLPVRHAAAEGVGDMRPAYEDLSEEWTWKAMVDLLCRLYERGAA